MDINYDVKTFTSKYHCFKKTWVAFFADTIKIVNMFIKTIFKDSRNVKRLTNYETKCNLYLYFLI